MGNKLSVPTPLQSASSSLRDQTLRVSIVVEMRAMENEDPKAGEGGAGRAASGVDRGKVTLTELRSDPGWRLNCGQSSIL